MIKIAIIGAGSVGYARNTVKYLLTVPELKDNLEIALMDINEHNLDMVYTLCKRDMEHINCKSKITKTLDRALAISDADYVLCFVRVGGLEAFETDISIPLKYGPCVRSIPSNHSGSSSAVCGLIDHPFSKSL